MNDTENIKCSANRIDNGEKVIGYYFKTPLTSENFEADNFSCGVTRHCIANKDGVVYEIDVNTLTNNLQKIIDTQESIIKIYEQIDKNSQAAIKCLMEK